MKIGIIGTGAMASFFAARLNPVAQIVMIGTWQAQIDAINQNGLTLLDLDGRETQHHFVATADPTTVGPVDVALVLTKSYQTIEAVERVERVLAPDGVVVTLQNGLGNLEEFVAVFGRHHCTAGIISLGATLMHPGYVRHAGAGTVHLGIPTDAPKHLTQFAHRLKMAGVPLQPVEEVVSLLWSKVAINAGINPLTALFNVPNGQLATDDTLRPIMVAAAQEAAAVATALNVTLTYEDVSTEIVRIATATATNRSSMLQDVTRGAPTEIDAICGAVVRIGRKTAIPTPVNAVLYNAIIDLESGKPPNISIKQLQLLANLLQ